MTCSRLLLESTIARRAAPKNNSGTRGPSRLRTSTCASPTTVATVEAPVMTIPCRSGPFTCTWKDRDRAAASSALDRTVEVQRAGDGLTRGGPTHRFCGPDRNTTDHQKGNRQEPLHTPSSRLDDGTTFCMLISHLLTNMHQTYNSLTARRDTVKIRGSPPDPHPRPIRLRHESSGGGPQAWK